MGLAHLRSKIVVSDLFYSGLQVQLVPDLRILVKAGVAHRQLLVFDGYGLDTTLKLLRLDESGGVHKFMHRNESTSTGVRFEEVLGRRLMDRQPFECLELFLLVLGDRNLNGGIVEALGSRREIFRLHCWRIHLREILFLTYRGKISCRLVQIIDQLQMIVV